MEVEQFLLEKYQQASHKERAQWMTILHEKSKAVGRPLASFDSLKNLSRVDWYSPPLVALPLGVALWLRYRADPSQFQSSVASNSSYSLIEAVEIIWGELDTRIEYDALDKEAESSSMISPIIKKLQNHKRQKNFQPSPLLCHGRGLESPEYPEEGVTKGFVQELIQHVLARPDHPPLTKEDFARLLQDTLTALSNEKMVNRIDIPEKGRLTVVGDLHGQLQDLFTIFQISGFPSPSNRFVFNGDFVDRGKHAVHIISVLFALHLLYPNDVMLNRGNHESVSMNERYAFKEQVKKLYGLDVFQKITDVFNQLSICTVISNKVFVCHGGLTEVSDLHVDDVDKIKKDYMPSGKQKVKESIVFQQLLWSDPEPKRERGLEPSPRGAGVRFGKQVTQEFLERHGFEMMIRSHEMVKPGYLEVHGGLCVTVFSASNYCGSSGNKGAIAVFENGSTKPEYKQYMAKNLDPKMEVVLDGPAPSALGGGVGDTAELEESVLHEKRLEDTLASLKDLIVESKDDLMYAFSQASSDDYVPLCEWCSILRAVLGLETVAFDRLAPYLCDVEGSRVNWKKFVARYHMSIELSAVPGSKDGEIMSYALTVFKKYQNQLVRLFEIMDTDQSGMIDLNEFQTGITGLMEHLPKKLPPEDILRLFKLLDKDGNGGIDIAEFQSGFTVVEQRS